MGFHPAAPPLVVATAAATAPTMPSLSPALSRLAPPLERHEPARSQLPTTPRRLAALSSSSPRSGGSSTLSPRPALIAPLKLNQSPYFQKLQRKRDSAAAPAPAPSAAAPRRPQTAAAAVSTTAATAGAVPIATGSVALLQRVASAASTLLSTKRTLRHGWGHRVADLDERQLVLQKEQRQRITAPVLVGLSDDDLPSRGSGPADRPKWVMPAPHSNDLELWRWASFDNPHLTGLNLYV